MKPVELKLGKGDWGEKWERLDLSEESNFVEVANPACSRGTE